MKTMSALLLCLIAYAGSARSDQNDRCQLEIQKAYLKIPDILEVAGPEIEVNTKQSFWYGTYGIDLQVSGNLYAAFGNWAEGGMAFPIIFPDNVAPSAGLEAEAEKMKTKIAAAALSKSRILIDFAELKGIVDAWGRCHLNGITIEKIIKIKTETARPSPETGIGHDQSETLPEGRAASGKVLPNGGDR